MAETRLRIVSDLHVAEGPSRLRHVRALRPLFDDAAHLVFNGDTLETRFLDRDPVTVGHKAEFAEFLSAHAGRVTVVTGNHDPDLSPLHHLDLEEGRVLVTHGDTLFPDMAPWGWEARYFQLEQEKRLAATPSESRHSWETRLRVCKESIYAIRNLSPRAPAPPGRPWRRWFRFLFSVRRAHWIPLTWMLAPNRAARLAEQFRPEARVIIFGHTHYPGAWRSRGRMIINTGSALPPLGGVAVDFVDQRIEIRRLELRHGEARVGRVVTTLELDATLSGGDSRKRA